MAGPIARRTKELLTKLKGPDNIKRLIVMDVDKLEKIISKEKINDMISEIDYIIKAVEKDKK